MTVRELINRLIDCPKDMKIGVCIKKHEGNDEIWVVGSGSKIRIETPQQIGEPNICWISSEIEKEYIKSSVKKNI